MNIYGDRALHYWQRFRPRAYQSIDNPTEHFSLLGEQIAYQVDALIRDLAGPPIPNEDYLAHLGRLTNATMRAQAMVMSELVYSSLPEEQIRDAPEEDNPAARYLVFSRALEQQDREERDRMRRDREDELDRTCTKLFGPAPLT